MSRFLSALAGLFLLVLAVALFIRPGIETLAMPDAPERCFSRRDTCSRPDNGLTDA